MPEPDLPTGEQLAELERLKANAEAERSMEYLNYARALVAYETRLKELAPGLIRAAKERDASERSIPATFYADLPLPQRIQFMAQSWNRAVAINHQLEAERGALQAQLAGAREDLNLLDELPGLRARVSELESRLNRNTELRTGADVDAASKERKLDNEITKLKGDNAALQSQLAESKEFIQSQSWLYTEGCKLERVEKAALQSRLDEARAALKSVCAARGRMKLCKDHSPLRFPLCPRCQLEARIEEAAAVLERDRTRKESLPVAEPKS